MSNEHISYTEYKKLMNRIAGWLVQNKTKFNKRQLYGYMNKTATLEAVEKNVGSNYTPNHFVDYPWGAEYVECAVEDNKDLGFLPAYVTSSNGTKYYKNCYVSMAKRVAAYEVKNKVSPAIVYVYDNHGNGTTSNTVDATLQKFINAFGAVTDIDSCLAKIKGRVYAYYYNSHYNTDTTISRIKNKKGVNCTDASQLFYRLGIALGYTVQFIHVKCSGGDGHIRLRLKHPRNTGGKWIYRDPAAVLKGNSITSNWCMNGKVIAYDPAWIFNDLYQ